MTTFKYKTSPLRGYDLLNKPINFCRSRWRRPSCCLRSLSLKLWMWLSYIHNFIIILSRVYNEPIQRPAPSWLVSLIGRAMHRYRRGQGFESRTSFVQPEFFFRLSFRSCKNCVYNCDDLPSYNAPYHCSMEKKRTNSPCLQHWRSHHALVTTGQHIPVHTNRQDEEESEKTTEIGRKKRQLGKREGSQLVQQ